MNHYPIEPTCFANHLGVWACEPTWLAQALAAVKAGTWQVRAMEPAGGGYAPGVLSTVTPEAVGILGLDGPLMKGWSKFCGTSSVAVRRELRAMAEDDRVRSIMLRIDSPGGTVAGIDDLARNVAATDAKKPVHAYIEDLGASAAYWVASQARRIYANPTALVGSIGAYVVLEDSSKAAEIDGIRVRVVSTGAMKGAGTPGTPVTDEQVAAVQAQVDVLAAVFFEAVSSKRGLRGEALSTVTTGDVWIASKAKALGLVDRIVGWDQIVGELGAQTRATPRRARAALALARLRRPPASA